MFKQSTDLLTNQRKMSTTVNVLFINHIAKKVAQYVLYLSGTIHAVIGSLIAGHNYYTVCPNEFEISTQHFLARFHVLLYEINVMKLFESVQATIQKNPKDLCMTIICCL